MKKRTSKVMCALNDLNGKFAGFIQANNSKELLELIRDSKYVRFGEIFLNQVKKNGSAKKIKQ